MRGQILICLGLFSSIYASRGAGANLFLRHHLNIALRRAPWRLRLHGSDRALMVRMTRVWPSLLLDLSRVIQPETRSWWDRAGFRALFVTARIYFPHRQSDVPIGSMRLRCQAAADAKASVID